MVLSWPGFMYHNTWIPTPLPDVKQPLLQLPLLPDRCVPQPLHPRPSLSAFPAELDTFPHWVYYFSAFSCQHPKLFISDFLKIPLKRSHFWSLLFFLLRCGAKARKWCKMYHLARYSFILASHDVRLILNNFFLLKEYELGIFKIGGYVQKSSIAEIKITYNPTSQRATGR